MTAGGAGEDTCPYTGFYLIPRLASSASSARSRMNAKNSGDWPMKSPMAVRKFRANDRNHGELSAQEWARFRHDQVGLKVLATKWRRIQVWKGDGHASNWINRGQGRRITRLIRPGLKVHCLRGADADQDSQDLHVSGPLRHRGIEAVATLFDRWKMESRRVGNRLKEVRVLQVIIGSGNCRMLPNRQSGDRLREGVTQIGVLGAAAVPSPPTGVQRELREVCEP